MIEGKTSESVLQETRSEQSRLPHELRRCFNCGGKSKGWYLIDGEVWCDTCGDVEVERRDTLRNSRAKEQ